MLVDFHTHLDEYKSSKEVSNIISENRIITLAAAMDVESYINTKKMYGDNKYVIPTFGIHPMRANDSINLNSLDLHLKDSKIIGEIGLDDFWVKDIPLKNQEVIFEYILDHCNYYNKYCVIHTKGAEKRVLEILKNFPKSKPIIHWYSGPIPIFKKMIDSGYYQTFGCQLKYSNLIKELLKITPKELILSETDNPNSEIWLGGSSDSPLLISRVVNDISKTKGEDLKSKIFENSMNIIENSGIFREFLP